MDGSALAALDTDAAPIRFPGWSSRAERDGVAAQRRRRFTIIRPQLGDEAERLARAAIIKNAELLQMAGLVEKVVGDIHRSVPQLFGDANREMSGELTRAARAFVAGKENPALSITLSRGVEEAFEIAGDRPPILLNTPLGPVRATFRLLETIDGKTRIDQLMERIAYLSAIMRMEMAGELKGVVQANLGRMQKPLQQVRSINAQLKDLKTLIEKAEKAGDKVDAGVIARQIATLQKGMADLAKMPGLPSNIKEIINVIRQEISALGQQLLVQSQNQKSTHAVGNVVNFKGMPLTPQQLRTAGTEARRAEVPQVKEGERTRFTIVGRIAAAAKADAVPKGPVDAQKSVPAAAGEVVAGVTTAAVTAAAGQADMQIRAGVEAVQAQQHQQQASESTLAATVTAAASVQPAEIRAAEQAALRGAEVTPATTQAEARTEVVAAPADQRTAAVAQEIKAEAPQAAQQTVPEARTDLTTASAQPIINPAVTEAPRIDAPPQQINNAPPAEIVRQDTALATPASTIPIEAVRQETPVTPTSTIEAVREAALPPVGPPPTVELVKAEAAQPVAEAAQIKTAFVQTVEQGKPVEIVVEAKAGTLGQTEARQTVDPEKQPDKEVKIGSPDKGIITKEEKPTDKDPDKKIVAEFQKCAGCQGGVCAGCGKGAAPVEKPGNVQLIATTEKSITVGDAIKGKAETNQKFAQNAGGCTACGGCTDGKGCMRISVDPQSMTNAAAAFLNKAVPSARPSPG